MRAKPLKVVDAILADGRLIRRALAKGAREALVQHKRAGLPIVIYRDGKTVWIPADKIPVGRPRKRRKAAPKA